MSCDQTASTSNAAFSMLNENAVMNIQRSEEISSCQKYFSRYTVKAAKLLENDSSTEVVNVSKLYRANTSQIRHVEIGVVDGLLHCTNDRINTARWMKVVPFANDCHSYNMLLMLTTEGVIMKTVRNIGLGEELLMWFDYSILTILDLSFLRPFNIQGYNRYVCHICNKSFEFPNPLKVHIALKCDRRNISHVWYKLSNEFSFMMMPHNTRTVTAPANGCSRAVQTITTINNLERSSQGYSCVYCGKVFRKKCDLMIHVSDHTGSIVYKCEYCYRTFEKRGHWMYHTQLHLQRMDYGGRLSYKRKASEQQESLVPTARSKELTSNQRIE